MTSVDLQMKAVNNLKRVDIIHKFAIHSSRNTQNPGLKAIR